MNTNINQPDVNISNSNINMLQPSSKVNIMPSSTTSAGHAVVRSKKQSKKRSKKRGRENDRDYRPTDRTKRRRLTKIRVDTRMNTTQFMINTKRGIMDGIFGDENTLSLRVEQRMWDDILEPLLLDYKVKMKRLPALFSSGGELDSLKKASMRYLNVVDIESLKSKLGELKNMKACMRYFNVVDIESLKSKLEELENMLGKLEEVKNKQQQQQQEQEDVAFPTAPPAPPAPSKKRGRENDRENIPIKRCRLSKVSRETNPHLDVESLCSKLEVVKNMQQEEEEDDVAFELDNNNDGNTTEDVAVENEDDIQEEKEQDTNPPAPSTTSTTSAPNQQDAAPVEDGEDGNNDNDAMVEESGGDEEERVNETVMSNRQKRMLKEIHSTLDGRYWEMTEVASRRRRRTDF